MNLFTYKDREKASKLVEFQIDLLQKEKRFNNFNFLYFAKVDKDTREILYSKEYFYSKIDNLLFYTLSKEFFFEIYPQPKSLSGIRKSHFISLPLLLVHYAIGFYIFRVSKQLIDDNKLSNFDTYYGGDLNKIVESNFGPGAKDGALYWNYYKNFAKKVKEQNTNNDSRIIIQLDIQNYFENISLQKLFSNLQEWCKISELQKNGLNVDLIDNIVFYYKFLGKGNELLPQSEGNFMSSFISDIFLKFGDIIIDDKLKLLLQDNKITSYNVIRYVDDSYIILDFSNKDNYRELIMTLISEITESFFQKLGLRFNSKVNIFDLSRTDDIKEFNESIKSVSPDMDMEEEMNMINETDSPELKAKYIIEVVKKIKTMSPKDIVMGLGYEEREGLKYIYDKSVNEIFSRRDMKEELDVVLRGFDYELLKISCKPLVVLVSKSTNKFIDMLKYINKLTDSYRRLYLALIMITQDDENMNVYLGYIKSSKYMSNIIHYGLYDFKIISEYLYNNEKVVSNFIEKDAFHNLLQQIKLKKYYEMKEERGVSFNHMLNEFHGLCYIISNNPSSFDKFDRDKVISLLEQMGLPRYEQNIIRRLFDRRNNNPISHPGTNISLSKPISQNEYEKFSIQISEIIDYILRRNFISKNLTMPLSTMNITKTLFTEFSSSPKKAWFHRNDKKTYTSIVEAEYGAMDGSELGQSIEDQVKLLLGEHIIVTPEGDYDMAFTETKQLLANYPAVIYQPWFQSDDLQIRCDFLVRNESGTYDLREVKAKNTVRKPTKAEPLLDDLLNDISFQKYVLHKTLGSQFSGKCFLVHLNKEYVRQGDIDVKQLIKIQDVTDEALTNEEIEHTLSLMHKQLGLSREEFEKIYPYNGEDHLEYFGTEAPKGSIRYLPGVGAKKKTLYELGKTDILTLGESEREILLSAKGEPSKASLYLDLYQTAQSVADIPAIKRELESLEYPLFFYDYETIASPVPLFDGTTPYQAVVIQYSVHKIDQDGTITHREAIIRDKIENNKAIIDQLYDDLEGGKHGTYIVRYKGFENTRNNESALMYPQYKDFFETVNRKTFDLMEIFSKLLYFDRGFKGSASIKKVLPIMTDISYDGLDVPNGSIATGLLLDIAVGKMSDTEKEQHIKNLLIYCEQDTRAMVRIWEELWKKIL